MRHLLLITIMLYSSAGLTAGLASEPAQEEMTATALSHDSDEQHQDAQHAMQAGNYAIAYCIWRPLAAGGDAEAQFNLGWMYHNGYGLAIDNRETVAWWRQAAEQGHANAAFALGLLLSRGDEQVERDLPQAIEYFLEAASQDHQDARQMLLHLIDAEQEVALPLLANGTPAQWQLLGPTLTVGSARANARTAPGTSSRVVAVLEQGAELIRLGQQSHWVKVLVPEQSLVAWVHDSLLRQ